MSRSNESFSTYGMTTSFHVQQVSNIAQQSLQSYLCDMPDPRAVNPSASGLRALSHPTRLRMLMLLRLEGPATATSLAIRLGLNTGSTSYHLRQLEKHGFVVEDETRGNARDRWWKAAHQMTQSDSAELTTPEEHDTYDAFLQDVAMIQHERLLRSLDERRLLPPVWRDSSDMSDWAVRVTPARAEELVKALHAVVEQFTEDDDPAARPFHINLTAHV